MTQKDKDAVIAALEEYKGDCIGLIAATIEDCQRVVREMAVDDGWVPVTERLPELTEEQLERIAALGDSFAPEFNVFILGARVATTLFYDGNDAWYDQNGTCYCVTHWMPLPEPPKEIRNG